MPRRLAWPPIVTVVGLLLLADYVVVNPSLASVAGALSEVLVLLAAAAAITGTISLVARHGSDLLHGTGNRAGSVALLVGLAVVLVAGFRPGSAGAGDPVTRWLVAALLVPLIASLFALLFFYTLAATRRGLLLRGRETGIMLAAATAVLILLLPFGGALGDALEGVGGWLLAVPVGAVFRGLLLGIAILTAAAAAKLIFGMDAVDD
ncbi:MAG: hypothetical protein M3R05_05470 [Chloroflexota bacterium]|nr:hypothetical protein [Chloroflexota bacterium]